MMFDNELTVDTMAILKEIVSYGSCDKDILFYLIEKNVRDRGSDSEWVLPELEDDEVKFGPSKELYDKDYWYRKTYNRFVDAGWVKKKVKVKYNYKLALKS